MNSLLLSLVASTLSRIGQLAIVAAFSPLAYSIRQSWSYPRLVLTGGSLAVIAIASSGSPNEFDFQLWPS